MYKQATIERVEQGDVFKDLEFKYAGKDEGLESITFPFWVVLSQDCDLEHDFNAHNEQYRNQDKKLQTILLCPAFISSQLRDGSHMLQLMWNMEKWSSDPWKLIKKNRDYRFHLLPENEELGIPELAVDFKRFFTLPRDYVYLNIDKRVTTMDDLFKESLSQRFAYYVSRVALPEENSP